MIRLLLVPERDRHSSIFTVSFATLSRLFDGHIADQDGRLLDSHLAPWDMY